MFRSISAQLQFSYGLLVLMALAGLGVFAWQFGKSEVYREIDERLLLRSRQIHSMLVRFDLDQNRLRDAESTVPALPPLPGSAMDSQPEVIDYQVWRVVDGKLALQFQSEDFPETTLEVPFPRDLSETGIVETTDSRRMMLSRAVRSYIILVSRDIADQKANLRQFLLGLVAGELLFLLFFLGAGYWLTRRALKPIGKISGTARHIADGKLDQRILAEGGSSELTDLSEVLNSTFDQLETHILRERQFTANASHELRTPITAILTAAQSNPKTIEDFRVSLDQCADSARSMKQLVEQLLQLARVDSGDAFGDRALVDLDLLVDRCLQSVQPAAGKKSITIESSLEPVQAEVNAVGISQVVTNLLANAVAYTNDGGRVEVRLSEAAGGIEISVSDNGKGIAEADLPRLFERFYCGDKSRSDHGSHHFGLGLAISKEIAEAHDGRILVETELGSGSVFTLRLPA